MNYEEVNQINNIRNKFGQIHSMDKALNLSVNFEGPGK
jgi:hypothetical protein